MRGIFTKRWFKLIGVTTASAMLFFGCGTYANNATVTNYTGTAIKNSKTDTVEVDDEENAAESEVAASEELYVIENFNMSDETMTLYSIDSGKQLRYSYNMTTKFLDKYGSNSTWAEFTTGSVVSISGMLPSSGALRQVQKSPDVWSYEDISKYTIDDYHNMITIDDKKYKITDDTRIYSDINQIQLADIGEDDIITVIGKDKEVYSIAITTGHGYITLVNTSLFDGSLIFIGNKIVSKVNGEETIEVPEGTYTVTVANNGWGGSEEFTIERNANTLVDLDSMKGEGPSFCLVTFLVTVPDTYVYIDGKIIDVTEPQYVQYGTHRLVVRCSGYKPWNKTLVVNSESAEITLAMESDDDTATDTTETAEETEEETTTSDTSEEETAGSAIKNDYDYEVDYLSTISDLLGNLMN